MKVFHISENSNGYELVTLLAKRYNKTNRLAVIQNDEGETFFTGGFLLPADAEVKLILDQIPESKLYEVIKKFKVTPFVKPYFLK